VAEGTWYINEDTFDTVDVDESTWSLEDNDDEEYDGGGGSRCSSGSKSTTKRRKVITIYLIKARRGILWEAALKGNPSSAGATTGSGDHNNNDAITTTVRMDPLAQEAVRKELLLQRFQEENAGFDFRGAEFNGSVPDARDFMGGIQYR
jgi:hypothetical protein